MGRKEVPVCSGKSFKMAIEVRQVGPAHILTAIISDAGPEAEGRKGERRIGLNHKVGDACDGVTSIIQYLSAAVAEYKLVPVAFVLRVLPGGPCVEGKTASPDIAVEGYAGSTYSVFRRPRDCFAYAAYLFCHAHGSRIVPACDIGKEKSGKIQCKKN